MIHHFKISKTGILVSSSWEYAYSSTSIIFYETFLTFNWKKAWKINRTIFLFSNSYKSIHTTDYRVGEITLTWFSDNHKAWSSLSLTKVKGRHLSWLSLRLSTRRRGIRPISSGMYSSLLLRRDNTVIPLQLPNCNYINKFNLQKMRRFITFIKHV